VARRLREPTINDWISNRQLMDRWGCSYATICHKVAIGELERRVLNNRRHEISMKSIMALEEAGLRPPGRHYRTRGKPRSDGWKTAEAFRLFRQGADLVQVAIAIQMTPDEVLSLYEKFKDPDLEEALVRKKMGIYE